MVLPGGQEISILQNIINGTYSDWFVNEFLVQSVLAINNNITILLIFGGLWVKVSSYTRGKWDDKASGWFMRKVTDRYNKIIGKKRDKL